MEEMQNETLNEFKTFVGVRFSKGARAYFFGVKEDVELKIGDAVVVETVRGIELGEIAIEAIDIKKYNSDFGLKPIIRVATPIDIKTANNNLKDAKIAMEICQTEINRLNLDMKLISCEYTLDKNKIIFSFLSDNRVDFRDLLKSLASKLRTRIELRQIGTRDKAKMVGGIGVCGLPLCCATFLNEFDGICINRAKNQMLAINIPKLSGQCGKLICCLKYEDDAYTEERKRFPELGTKVFIDKVEFTVTNINIISNVVKVENPDDIKFLSLDEFNKQTGFNKRRDHKNDKKESVRKQ